MIDGTPHVMLNALDPDKDLIHMPLVARTRSPPAHSVSEAGAKLLAPTPHGLTRDRDATLSQKQLNIQQTESEHMIEPDGMADDLSREPVAVMRIG